MKNVLLTALGLLLGIALGLVCFLRSHYVLDRLFPRPDLDHRIVALENELHRSEGPAPRMAVCARIIAIDARALNGASRELDEALKYKCRGVAMSHLRAAALALGSSSSDGAAPLDCPLALVAVRASPESEDAHRVKDYCCERWGNVLCH